MFELFLWLKPKTNELTAIILSKLKYTKYLPEIPVLDAYKFDQVLPISTNWKAHIRRENLFLIYFR
jgi:hypothetical protein